MLLSASGLTISFPADTGRVDAVRGVDLQVNDGDTIAGESGPGKSTIGRSIIRLDENRLIEGLSW